MSKQTTITYNPQATVTCANCSSVYTLGLTVDKLTAEICGNCHPYYTGQEEVFLDTAGQIGKIEKRMKMAEEYQAGKSNKQKSRKTRQSLADLTA